MTRKLPTLLVLFSCLVDLSAQTRSFTASQAAPRSLSGASLQGQVIAKGVDVSRSFVVELVGCQQSCPGLQSSLSADGGFSFEGLESGCYQLRVLTLQQRELVHREVLNVDRNSGEIVIDLHTESAERANGGFVSLQQLLKPPPKKARLAYEQAVRSASKGQMDAAMSSYSRAIELFPDFASAHQGLAEALEKQNHPSEAVAEWGAACRLGIESPELYTGLSLSLLEINRREEAEKAAREALSKDPSYAPTHYLLACSLVLQAKSRVEALAHFSRAASRLPRAWLMSARLRAAGGDFEGARRELSEYRKVCPASERPSADRWLNEMQPRRGFRRDSR